MVQNTQGPLQLSPQYQTRKQLKKEDHYESAHAPASSPIFIKHTFIYPVGIHFVSLPLALFHSAHLSSPNYSSPALNFHVH